MESFVAYYERIFHVATVNIINITNIKISSDNFQNLIQLYDVVMLSDDTSSQLKIIYFSETIRYNYINYFGI